MPDFSVVISPDITGGLSFDHCDSNSLSEQGGGGLFEQN